LKTHIDIYFFYHTTKKTPIQMSFSPLSPAISAALVHALSTLAIAVYETPQRIDAEGSPSCPSMRRSGSTRTIAFQQHGNVTCARSLMLQFDQEANAQQDEQDTEPL
jgi:hypothetical protein